MFGSLPVRISRLPTATRNCTKKTGRGKGDDLDLFCLARPLGADSSIPCAGALPWCRCCGQLCRHKRVSEGHGQQPTLVAIPSHGDPLENRAFLVFDLFPVMSRFLLAVRLLVYSSLLQLPLSLSFLIFSPSPAWWSPCSS